jgi:hypothetical protein
VVPTWVSSPFGASVDQDRRLAEHGVTVDDLVATIRQLVS